MNNLKETFATLQKLSEWRVYINKERFTSYAKARGSCSNREVKSLWEVWDRIVSLNWYGLLEISDENIELAISVAGEVYEAVCNGAHVHWRENKPNTPKWRVYYRTGEVGEIQQTDVDLREKLDAIRYSLLLQQDGVEICSRLDYFETVTVSCGTTGISERAKLDIYDGDIIFCTEDDKWSFSDNSGAYVCTGGCYKRLMYTPGRGYIRRGELDFEQDQKGMDCRYNNYVFNAYDRRFKVVGNIYVDNSVLIERKEDLLDSL